MQELIKDKQSRKYQLTINNPLKISEDNPVQFTHEEIKDRISKLSTVTYYCMSDEIGLNEQTPHTHIFLYSSSPIRFSTVKKQFPTAHIESAYGTAVDNKDYILKSGKWAETNKKETSIENSFEEWGEMPKETVSKNGDLHFLIQMIENGLSSAEILKAFPNSILMLDKIDKARTIINEDKYKNVWRDIHTTYIYGSTNTGKTRDIMELYGYENVYRITDYMHPWDMYDSSRHKVVLFEEFRSSLKIQDMLNYLDGYPCSLPARYNNKQASYTEVYITTNIPLEMQYSDIQYNESETWLAFLRRINEIVVYTKDEKKIKYSSVDEYFKQKTKNIISDEDFKKFFNEN